MSETSISAAAFDGRGNGRRQTHAPFFAAEIGGFAADQQDAAEFAAHGLRGAQHLHGSMECASTVAVTPVARVVRSGSIV